MRKKSVLTNVLLAAVLLGAVANLLVFVRYVQVLDTAQRLQFQTQRLQSQAAAINRNYGVARSLAAEALEFGQQQPEMEAVLRPFTPLLQRMELVTSQPSE